MTRDAYARAGVDRASAETAVHRARVHARTTRRPGVMGDVGAFGGWFSLVGRYRDPVLVSGVDGVGTKLLLAQALGRHHGVGIDLVAMCVNDVAVHGAEPLFFLDYVATGTLDLDAFEQVMAGIAEGCRLAGCALLGGETAQLPGMLREGQYDLAGFCVGAVEREALVDGSAIRPGDAIVGLPSSGLHSNGYALARALLEELPMDSDPGLGAPLGDVLLAPTRIYVRSLLDLHTRGVLLGAAHVTGGGLTGNVPRCLPPGLGAHLDRGAWTVPPLFELLRRRGGLTDAELFGTFNCGIGMVVVVRREVAEQVAIDTGGRVVGRVVDDTSGACVIA
jgi:phosphoribosylformylglycinamidine cyclo-ligase